MKDIRIDVGVCTALSIDLSTVDFTGIKEVIFTIKNQVLPSAPEIVERSFTEPKVYEVVITPEESMELRSSAEYDFSSVLKNGKKFKMTDNGKVVLRRAVGDCIDN